MNEVDYIGFGLAVGIALLPALFSMRGIGRLVLAVILSFAFLPQLFIGGVVIEMKFDDGYWVLLRGNPNDWVETNWALYYAHKTYPWALTVFVGYCLAVECVRLSKKENEHTSQ